MIPEIYKKEYNHQKIVYPGCVVVIPIGNGYHFYGTDATLAKGLDDEQRGCMVEQEEYVIPSDGMSDIVRRLFRRDYRLAILPEIKQPKTPTQLTIFDV